MAYVLGFGRVVFAFGTGSTLFLFFRRNSAEVGFIGGHARGLGLPQALSCKSDMPFFLFGQAAKALFHQCFARIHKSHRGRTRPSLTLEEIFGVDNLLADFLGEVSCYIVFISFSFFFGSGGGCVTHYLTSKVQNKIN